MPDDSGELAVNTRVHSTLLLSHARLRVHWAPGIPHALSFEGRKIRANLGRNAPRECEAVSRFAVIASEGKQSLAATRKNKKEWIASLRSQ
jgi:hypothetical protein